MSAEAEYLAKVLDEKDIEYRIQKTIEAEAAAVHKRFDDFLKKEREIISAMREYLYQQHESKNLDYMLTDINRRYKLNTKPYENCWQDFKEAGYPLPDTPWRIILRVMHQDNVALFVDHMVEKFNEK